MTPDAVPWPRGVLLVDKPGAVTSHHVVAVVRRLAGTRKVGHAGTLDPAATGLLVVGVGAATRLLTHLVGLDKEYTATIRLGAATTTDDADGEEISRARAGDLEEVTAERIRGGIAALTGELAQVPSAVSAIKVDGKRAYTRVRDGETVELRPRTVTVHAFELLSMAAAPASIDVEVRVACSSGTYVRALARDLGAGLGVGGHLTALRRTRVGPFRVADALPPDDPGLRSALLDPAAVAVRLFPTLELSADQAVDLGHGKRVPVADTVDTAGPVAALAPDGHLAALVEIVDGRARVLTGFPDERTSG